MGYNTSYSLTVMGGELAPEALAKLIAEDEDAQYALYPNGKTQESWKWYKHEDSLLHFSNAFPDIIFALHGEGDEAADVWDEYYRRGMLVHKEKIKPLEQLSVEAIQLIERALNDPR